MFVDEVVVRFEAGKGGDGCVSFRREKYVPLGGPDGGDGGDGGSVVLMAREGVDSLAMLAHKKAWKAEPGEHGTGANCHGRSAKDLTIAVPPGTVIIDAEHGHVLKDLAKEGDQVIVARGGKGGKGNNRFKTATNRAPRQSTPGELGEIRSVRLELKLIADVGLVGLPNAGKSTLLSRLSRARPEIAPYPFTTKHPNLGRVQIDADRAFIMADIPGPDRRRPRRRRAGPRVPPPHRADGHPRPPRRARTDRRQRPDRQLSDHPRRVGAIQQPSWPRGRRSPSSPRPICRKPKRSAAAWRNCSAGEVLLISAVTGQGLNQLVAAISQTLQPAEKW